MNPNCISLIQVTLSFFFILCSISFINGIHSEDSNTNLNIPNRTPTTEKKKGSSFLSKNKRKSFIKKVTTLFSCIGHMEKPVPFCDMSKYMKVREISNGRDGIVYLYKEIPLPEEDFPRFPPKYVVSKEPSPVANSWSNINNELDIMMKINGSDISANVICAFDNGFLMEHLRGIPLSQLKFVQSRFLAVEQFHMIGREMVTALMKLHKKGFLHLDLHLDNWFVENIGGGVHLLDFSRSRPIESDETKQTPVLTHAPETQEHGKGYSTKTDVYVLGLAFDDLLNGLLRDDEQHGTINVDVPEDLLKLIDRMQFKVPNDRPSLPDVKKYFDKVFQ